MCNKYLQRPWKFFFYLFFFVLTAMAGVISSAFIGRNGVIGTTEKRLMLIK